MKKKEFVWSDNWWIEEDKAWFIPGDGNCNAIFCMDLVNKSCSYIAEIPDGNINSARLYPRCIKYKNDIFCMPDMGKCIWVYELEKRTFTKIEINDPQNARLGIVNFWREEQSIFAISIGLNQIIEIDINKKEIVSYYNISENVNERVTWNSVCVDNSIFMASAYLDRIYQFDMIRKKIKTYELQGIEGKLHGICFDGNNFWLSGYKREIYKWNMERNSIEILKNIPLEFGIYKWDKNEKWKLDCKCYEYDLPAFLYIVFVNNCIWYIPFRTNKIIYVDKKTEDIKMFEISDEDEKRSENLRNRMKHKYILLYVIEERYIGLFSLENNYVIEIDSLNKEVKYVEYAFDKKAIDKIVELYNNEVEIYYEGIFFHHIVFGHKIDMI